MNLKAFIKMLELNGVYYDHHGGLHDIYKHKETGKIIPVPRPSEFSPEFLKDILGDIPRK